MSDLLPALLVLITGGAIAALVSSRFPAKESRLILASYPAHLLAALVQIWFAVRVYGYGDLLGYTGMGEVLASAMRVDVSQYGPEALKMLFHQEAAVPGDLPGIGSSTGSMTALSGILQYLTGGSTYTVNFIVATGAYFGQVALYKAFRNTFPAEFHRTLLVAALLIPSEVYWCSALLKEGVATLGLGCAVLGLERILHGARAKGLPLLGGGILVLGLFKAYIVVAFAISSGAWLYFRLRGRQTGLPNPIHLVLASILALGGNAMLVRVFPTYSIDNLAEQAAYYQHIGQEITGGSTYVIGDPTQTTLGGQLVYAPIALITSLFRPFLFEARSPQVFVNAIETTVILVFTVRLFVRRPLARIWELFGAYPLLAFCAVFVVVFGIGIGLTTTNMGTLSRYRMPLVPFLWGFVLVVRATDRSRAKQTTAPLQTRPRPLTRRVSSSS
jgi:hypothetical protein